MTSLLVLLLSCAPDAGVDISPQSWREQLLQARPGGHDPLLARLHLPAVGSPAWAPPTLASVELEPAHLSGASPPELLVTAVFTTRLEADRPGLSRDVRLTRVQVLRPESSRWCALGGPTIIDGPTEEPNAGPADGMKDTTLPPTFALVHFSHPTKESLEVHRRTRSISRMAGERTTVEWWDLVDGALVLRLSVERSTIDCPACEHRFNQAGFELRGPPPVTAVAFTRACDDPKLERTCETTEQVFTPPTWRPRP